MISRRGARWLAAAAALAVAPLAAGCRGADGAPQQARPASSAELASDVAAESAVASRRAVSVRRGETLAGVLRRIGLRPRERAAVVRALAARVDLRRILPGERLEVGRGPGGELLEARLDRDRLRALVVRFDAEGTPRVEPVEREPEIRIRCLRGSVEGSLWDAVLAAGGDADLVLRFADLLAWQVDFVTEPRAGDRFRILVEERWLDGEPLGLGRILAAEYEGRRAAARALRYEDASGAVDWYDDRGRSVRRAFLKSPLDYRRISSRFSARRRHPVLKKAMPHWGVDYAAPRGTPVSTVGAGVVTFAGRRGGLGKCVEVRHNATYTTSYAHLGRIAKGIRRGARVERGQLLGFVGATGIATGPHLDFRVRKEGRWVDPLRLEAPPAREVPPGERARFEAWRDRTWKLAERIAPGEAVPARAAWARVPPAGAGEELLALRP